VNAPCKYPGCRMLTREGYCPRHTIPRADNRPTAAHRGYSRHWSKVAKLHKAEHPLCQLCELEGRVTIATISHHVNTVSRGGSVIVAEDELVACCAVCHQRIEHLGHDWKRAARRLT
jgi:5-methylcytosine-specific restriction protein A